MDTVDPMKVLLVCSDDSPLSEAIRTYATTVNLQIEERSIKAFLDTPEAMRAIASHVVAVCDAQNAALIINAARKQDFSLGLVPAEADSPLIDWFALPANSAEQIPLAFKQDAVRLDVLTCNDEVVLGQMMMGKTPFLDGRSKTYLDRRRSLWRRISYWWSLLAGSLRNLLQFSPFPVTLTTGKDRVIRTIITGMVIIENEVRSAATRLLTTSVSVQDRKMSTMLIAPKSAVEYLAFVGTALFKGDHSVKRLPGAISYLKTGSLKVESTTPLIYYVDGKRREAEKLDLQIHPKSLRMAVGPKYLVHQGGVEEEKDTVRIENLPEQQDRVNMISQHLPFFTRALEEDFKDLFHTLREAATIRTEFVVLTILSAIVASLGLFLDSTAVIIGAMVLAPLMSPIISLAMGLLRGNQVLIKQPLITLGFGTALALVVAAIMAAIVPTERITPEISARVQPTLLDLGVAIASGIAGAYAFARESVAKSLPGVAIAVALVPPLCVAGIGIGWGDVQIITGASLLFITNLIGIALAAALTFLVLGYAPVIKSRRGLTISMGLLLAISIPLSVSFRNMHQTWSIEKGISAEIYTINEYQIKLKEVHVRLYRGKVLLRAEAVGSRPLSIDDLTLLKRKLEARWGRPVVMEIDSRLTL